jgi:hypothetical protein
VADNDAYAGRVDLLLRHGVDPDGRGTGHPALRGLRPVERARLHGAQRIEALLLAAGARPPEDDGVDALLALAVRGDRAGVERELAHDPGLAQALVPTSPQGLIDAAERANAAGVELLARSGYDVNARHGQAALHVAAYAGDRALCELLLRLGADPTIRDTSFDATPAGWAAPRAPRRPRGVARGSVKSQRTRG